MLYVSSISGRYSPVGVCCLVMSALLSQPDLFGTLTVFAYYLIAVLTAFFIHGCVLIPVTYAVVMRKNPLKLFARISDALVAGLAPPSG